MIAAVLVATAAASTPVGVSLREYELALGRRRVVEGAVRFNVSNVGEDIHDLAVRRRGRIVARTPEVFPAGRFVLRTRLRGDRTYVLVCTVADHEERGMKARLRVSGR